MNSAQKYIDGVKDGRNKDDCQIQEVEAGKEPPSFTVNFTGWTKEKAQKWLDLASPTKQGGNKGAAGAKGGASKPEEEHKSSLPAKTYLDPDTNKFPYETLKTTFPTGIDPTKKELYLENTVFEEVFKMKRDDYDKLKDWKKIDMRKKFGLF